MESSIPGYRFLCEILGSISISSQQKKMLLLHSQNESPMEKDQIKVIQANFVEFARELKRKRSKLWKDLDAFLGSYYNGISTDYFFSDAESGHSKSLESMFKSLLRDQAGTSNINFAGIAMTIALGVGYSQNPDFYIGSREICAILTSSMESLGYNNAEFIPDKSFAVMNDQVSEDLLQLLLLSLLGALKVKYPHKKSEAQSNKNREKAKEAVDTLIGSNHDSVILSTLRGSCEMSRICQGMEKALKDDAGKVRFPNGITLPLESFYRIPRFEMIGKSIPEILRCDSDFCIRSFVMGKVGSGKSLLTKAVVRTCLETPESRRGSYKEYAEKLGVPNKTYVPLVLNCKELTHGKPMEILDPIEEAVEQLVRFTRTTPYASCLTHWNEFSLRVIEYYKRKAKNSTLLLIVEDLSRLDRESREILIKKLREMERTEYSRLNILVVSQHLINSQMMRFMAYNRVEIAPLTFSLEEEIRNLVNLGVGVSSAEDYLSVLNSNRYVRSFVDSPEHLVRFLSYPYEGTFDFDELLWQTIDEHIEKHFSSGVSDADCRDFLVALAVGVAENRNGACISHRSSADYRNIPQNIVAKGNPSSLFRGISHPDVVWQHIMDHMILVCPNSGISSYSFVNPMFYCSLVADHYMQLMGTHPAPNWLDRFNRLSAEDFSSIVVMLLNRLCRITPESAGAPEEVSSYDFLLLLQSIVGYVVSRTESTELFYCLLALQDILSSERIKKTLPKSMWTMLEQVYATGYGHFVALSDDSVKRSRLAEPCSIGE